MQHVIALIFEPMPLLYGPDCISGNLAPMLMCRPTYPIDSSLHHLSFLPVIRDATPDGLQLDILSNARNIERRCVKKEQPERLMQIIPGKCELTNGNIVRTDGLLAICPYSSRRLMRQGILPSSNQVTPRRPSAIRGHSQTRLCLSIADRAVFLLVESI
jgi:hypothetical protein